MIRLDKVYQMRQKDQPGNQEKREENRSSVKLEEKTLEKQEVTGFDQMVKIEEESEVIIPKTNEKIKKIMITQPETEEGQIVGNLVEQISKKEQEQSQEEVITEPPIEEGYLKREPSTSNDDEWQYRSVTPNRKNQNEIIKEEDSKQENEDEDDQYDSEDSSDDDENPEENSEGMESSEDQDEEKEEEESGENQEEGQSKIENVSDSQSESQLEQQSDEDNQLYEKKLQEIQQKMRLILQRNRIVITQQGEIKIEQSDTSRPFFSQNFSSKPLTEEQLSFQFIVCPCGKLQTGPLHYLYHIQFEHQNETINDILLKRLVFYDEDHQDELQSKIKQEEIQCKQVKKEVQSEESSSLDEDYVDQQPEKKQQEESKEREQLVLKTQEQILDQDVKKEEEVQQEQQEEVQQEQQEEVQQGQEEIGEQQEVEVEVEVGQQQQWQDVSSSSEYDSSESEQVSNYPDEDSHTQFELQELDHFLLYQLEQIAAGYQEGNLTMNIKNLAKIASPIGGWNMLLNDIIEWAQTGTTKMKLILVDFFIYLVTFLGMQKMKLTPAKFLRNKNSFLLLYEQINQEKNLGIKIHSYDIERICSVLEKWFYSYGLMDIKSIEKVNLEAQSDLECSYTSELDNREVIKRKFRQGKLEMQEQTRSEPSFDMQR